MKQDLTELVFILDKSGSMAGLESDTIGGYNALLKKQQSTPGDATVTTVLFDDNDELLHDRINIRGVAPITENEYFVGGCTALLDAIGRTIRKIAQAQKHTAEAERAARVLFVITTDGMENASREYTFPAIRQLIGQQKERYGWEFIFLGANMDAIATAVSVGIDADRAVNYKADSRGTQLNYAVMNDVVSEFRASKKISKNWKEQIEKDVRNREPSQ